MVTGSLERVIGIIAGIMIGSAQIFYLGNTLRRKITPSILSWLGWAFLMGTSVVSQVVSKGWQWSLTSILCSTAGCVIIVLGAVFVRNFSLLARDWIFLILGLGCLGLYYLSKDAWVTTIFAILADGVLGIPTIVKAWKEPASERSVAWILGAGSSVLALSICFGHDMLYALFPIYLVLFNGGMAWLTWVRKV
ncbi:MAG: hypothetical protein JST68_22585 [Bacteroidetes bacterium]|nr:hypothetical protein [Bacteroidota bacterium]